MENNIELQEMREQLASFKRQLAGQKIINDKLMRKATAEKVGRLKRKKNNILGLGLFAVIVCPAIFLSFGFPSYFVVYTVLMIIFSMVMTVVYHSKVDKADFMNGDLRTAAHELSELRRKYTQWYWIAVPLVTIFLALFYYSGLQLDVNQEVLKSFLVGGGVGAVVGGVIGVLMNRNLVKLCDEIITDLENN